MAVGKEDLKEECYMLPRDFCKMPAAYAKIKYVRTPHLTVSHTVHPSWNRYAVIYCIRKKYCSPSNAVLVLTTNSFQILPLPLSFLFSLPCLAFALPSLCLALFFPPLPDEKHTPVFWRKYILKEKKTSSLWSFNLELVETLLVWW